MNFFQNFTFVRRSNTGRRKTKEIPISVLHVSNFFNETLIFPNKQFFIKHLTTETGV